jgi:hypothetical protein
MNPELTNKINKGKFRWLVISRGSKLRKIILKTKSITDMTRS